VIDDETVVGVFPLELVMLPGEAVPLHLFEPRYRQLLADCVLEQRPFVMARRVGEHMERIGCTATFETVVRRFEDGRVNVIARGGTPAEIIAPGTEDRLYDTARVALLVDLPAPGRPELEQRALDLFGELGGGATHPEAPTAVPLSYRLAGAVDMPLEAKQSLLENRSEDERLTQLVELLEQVEKGAAHARLASERASRNGKVSHP